MFALLLHTLLCDTEYTFNSQAKERGVMQARSNKTASENALKFAGLKEPDLK